MNKKLIIIDGNSLVNRAFYALPTSLTNKEGLCTNAIYGFTTMLFKMIDEYNPTHISVAFDKAAPTFRHKEYSQYKAGRKKMPEELAMQMNPLKDLLDVFKIHRFEIEGYEADDIIGTLTKSAENDGFDVLVVTGDKDAIQLASSKTRILITKKGLSELEEYDYDEVLKRYELTPDQFIDLKGIMGDKSDNIPGIPGIGEKTGIKLLKQFNSVENLINNIDKLKGKQREKIEENKESAIMSKSLATIVRDVPIDFKFEDLKLEEFDSKEIIKLFNKLGFESLISRVCSEKESVHTEIEKIDENNLKSIIKSVKNEGELVFKTISKKGNIVDKNIIYFVIGVNNKIFYTSDEQIIMEFKEILEDEDVKKCGYMLKDDCKALKSYRIDVKNIYFDIAIAEYLIDSTNTSYMYQNIAIKYLARQLNSEEEFLGKGKKAKVYEQMDEIDLLNYFAQIIELVIDVKDLLMDKINEFGMSELCYKVEMPLIKVLADMEFEGFAVDKQMLLEFDTQYSLIISQLEVDIHELAGGAFNINSPKQLGVILFEKLELPIIKKTKTGYSTDAEVLEKLKDKHLIINKISEYRQIVKLKTTYVDGLINIINEKTNRIHSSFNQTITTTGRISSTEPNLQNIPIKLEMGRNLRKVFIARENDFLVDADYSQIELRVLAHICEDENLIKAFLNDEDVHTVTASNVFSVKMQDVTKEMRSAAKAVNFGIVYGISDFGLAQNLNISVSCAGEYINNYFEKYSTVKQYMDETIEIASEKGYVTTLLNRRRYIPEIKSKNFMHKNFGKRLAMNTPIQGSAADIIKIAMVNVYNKLKEKNLKSKLILQVHDELIIEAVDEELEQIKELLKNEMESAMKLKVNLKVDLNVGLSWFETK